MKYSKRIGLNMPKHLLDRLDRVVLRDGRRRAEVVRTLICIYVESQENKDTLRGAAGGAAGGTPR